MKVIKLSNTIQKNRITLHGKEIQEVFFEYSGDMYLICSPVFTNLKTNFHTLGLICLLLCRPYWHSAQSTTYQQCWNEFSFTRPIADKYALETSLSNSFSDSPENASIFSAHTQFGLCISLHYYKKAKLNFSVLGAYYSNYYVPEIGQREYPEFRLSGQVTGFLKKIPYILQSRTRLEFRMIENTNGQFSEVFRLRERLRYTKPLNSKMIRQGTWFILLSDEVSFKSPSDLTGKELFDRNELTAGLGYAFTDNFQADLDYTLQHVPRPGGNEIYQALQINLQFYNPWLNLKRKVKKKQITSGS
ncbi:MAG TPA: DUF2490 domain-containing protein [Bacteroidia bacterium]|nr:DUF2490 domain-containing protein [Bacteroidia bacterium]